MPLNERYPSSNNDINTNRQIPPLNASREIEGNSQMQSNSIQNKKFKDNDNETFLDGPNAMRKSILSKYLNSKNPMKERSRVSKFPKISRANRFHHNTIQQMMDSRLEQPENKQLVISG